MKIEIVVNCYAAKRPWYAALFCYQLSSLILHEPKKCLIKVSACCSKEDKNTVKVLRFFQRMLPQHVLDAYDVDVSQIAKRAIHRNNICRKTTADILWFADPDYAFGKNCLDTLATLEWPENAVLVFPRHIKEQKHDAIHMPSLKMLTQDPQIVVLDDKGFEVKTFQRAIGSIQIVQGDFARKYGYCPKYKNHQTPTETPFKNYSSVSDRNFRRECRKHSNHPNFQQAIELPNVFRLSHPSRKLSPEKAKERYGWTDD